MNNWQLSFGLTMATLLHAATASYSQAQYTPVFFDGFEASADTFNLNFEYTTRQAGALAPVEYVAITPDVTDGFQHQLFSVETAPGQPLQIAENGSNPPNGTPPIFSYKTMVSPNFNFNGTVNGEVVGKRITFDLDVGVIAQDAGAGVFTQAGITIGSPSTLVDSEDQVGTQTGSFTPEYFSVHFIEDTFTPNEPFMQAYADGFLVEAEFVDGDFNGDFEVDVADYSIWRDNLGSSEELANSAGLGTPIGTAHYDLWKANFGSKGQIPGTFIPHGAEEGLLSVQLDIDDPADGNPWDGVGSTVINVSVNGNQIYTYTKDNGGFSDNFITLFGSRNFAGNQLATHTFDNFTVFSAPAAGTAGLSSANVPEPGTATLVAAGLLLALASRRLK